MTVVWLCINHAPQLQLSELYIKTRQQDKVGPVISGAEVWQLCTNHKINSTASFAQYCLHALMK